MRWIPLFLLIGCGTPWVESSSGDWRTLVTTLKSNSSGNIKATLRPEPGESNLLISFRPVETDRFSHLRFVSVDGDIPFRAKIETADDNPYSRSSAAYVSDATTFNWPIVLTDGSLKESTYTFTAGIVDGTRQYLQGTAEVGVLLKTDPDLTSGLLRVNLIYGGETVNDDEIVGAVDEAVQIWRDIYARAGIQLDITLYEDPHGVLQAPGQGNLDEYEAIARSTRFGAVNLILLEDISGFAGALGFSGNIPGPLISTGQSAVAVNVTLGAGTDGRFSPLETSILAETMAHEVGHFLGLYHPVESSFDQWDSLEDTPECSEGNTCEQALGSNLMYYIPLCSESGCNPQRNLSPDQVGLMNRYTGVL